MSPFLVKLRGMVAAIVLCVTLSAGAQSPVINEVMQSNVDCLKTGHDYPDSWLELYNPWPVPVDLTGWRVGIDSDTATAWRLPDSLVISPGHYQMIYCDKEARGVHTHFRLDSGKGSVTLWAADGSVAQTVKLSKQPAPNVSVGVPYNSTGWEVMPYPTPLAANCPMGADCVLDTPVFSREGAVMSIDSTVTVSVSVPRAELARYPDVKLCVTTDGSEPTISHWVGDSVARFMLNSSTVIRAKLFADDAASPRAVTQSFIFHPREIGIDVVSIVTDRAHLYGRDGILADGPDSANPNWMNDWRRPVNVEYFKADRLDQSVFNQLCETRVQGGVSRANEQKSMALYAHKRFGTKRFASSLMWADKPDVSEVKSFLLRNGGNTFHYERINDQLAQTMVGRNTRHSDWQAHTPALVFINGQYHGLMDVRERSNEDYVEPNYGGLEEIDMVENHYDLKAGSKDAYYNFAWHCLQPDLTLQRVKEMADVESFLDMLVINTFGYNTDFPLNNIVCWRPTSGADTRWRWILKDLDRFGMWNMRKESVAGDFLEYLLGVYNENPTFTGLFHFFITDSVASNLLVDHLTVAMGDWLQLSYATRMIKEMSEPIKSEYQHTMELYSSDGGKDAYDNWRWYVSELYHTWWPKRLINCYNQLRHRYSLGHTVKLAIYQCQEFGVEMQQIPLSQPTFIGRYYAGRPLHLRAFEPTRWEARLTDSVAARTDTVVRYCRNLHMVIPEECNMVRIRMTHTDRMDDEPLLPPVHDDASDLSHIIYDPESRRVRCDRAERITVYSLSGQRLAQSATDESSLVLDGGIKSGQVVLVSALRPGGITQSRKIRL